ncbi:hypothetical protein C8Q79DRAFT_946350 [Trametes meyenii]|nr:hypothetical protein C8Q79DRAFT_946350 [Trametes meyenii]
MFLYTAHVYLAMCLNAHARSSTLVPAQGSASGWHSATTWGLRAGEYSPCMLSSPSCSYETLIALLHLLTIRALAHLGHPWSRQL